jgi:hypothetical protein
MESDTKKDDVGNDSRVGKAMQKPKEPDTEPAKEQSRTGFKAWLKHIATPPEKRTIEGEWAFGIVSRARTLLYLVTIIAACLLLALQPANLWSFSAVSAIVVGATSLLLVR